MCIRDRSCGEAVDAILRSRKIEQQSYRSCRAVLALSLIHILAGIRNTSPIAELKDVDGLEEAGRELEEVFVTLENHFRDMCDIEFTIEQGKLWMLQTRVGKRTAAAALHIAIEMEKEGLISKEEAVMRVDPEQLDQLLHPQFDLSLIHI